MRLPFGISPTQAPVMLPVMADAAGQAVNYVQENPLQGAAIATTPVPVVGDVMGLLADADMYANEPESRNLLNYGLSALGVLPFVPSLAKRGKNVATEIEPNIIAYHGSPHDFDEFSLSKINTGEGHQAFGDGLYFTDSEDIAKHYRDSVSYSKQIAGFRGVNYKGKTIIGNDDLTPEEQSALNTVAEIIQTEGLRPEAALQKRKDILDREIASIDENADITLADGSSYNETMRKQLMTERTQLIGINPKDFDFSKGKIYKVGLNPKTDELLDYDKPLGEQTEFVKNGLISVADELNVEDAINLGFEPFDFGGNEKAAIEAARQAMLDVDMPVGNYLANWQALRGYSNAGEELLSEHGVKGLKYKAGQLTRNTDDLPPATNYVMFDDKLINILDKYGIIAPIAIGGGAGLLMNQEQDANNNVGLMGF